MVDTYGTGTVKDEELIECIKATFDSRPGKLIEHLDQRSPFTKDSTYGHFGQEEFRWEQTDMVDSIKTVNRSTVRNHTTKACSMSFLFNKIAILQCSGTVKSPLGILAFSPSITRPVINKLCQPNSSRHRLLAP